MQFPIKLLVALSLICVCAMIGKRVPSLSGLLATMPLTALLVMLWLHSDNPDNPGLLVNWTRGAVWGIIPTLLFFVSAHFCFQRQLSLPMILLVSFSVWLAGAVVHQWFLG